MNRIMVIGCSGAGKSTLATKISQRTGLPIIHLDQEYWQAGWTETPKNIWEPKAAALSEQEQWVMDGNYGGSMDIRFQRADTVIFLDRSTLTCLWRITKRILRYYGKTRPDMTAGCNERFDWEFYHYVATFNLRRRKGIRRKLAALPKRVAVVTIQSDQEAEQWLQQLPIQA